MEGPRKDLPILKELKMKRICAALVLFLLIIVSCSHEERVGAEISFDEAEVSNVQHFFSHAKIMSLKENGGPFLSDVSALEVYDDYMLVCDKRYILYLFSRDGNCISNSEDKIGHGEDEYSIITAYTFNQYSKCIEIVTPKDLLFFDINFKLKKRVPVPTVFSNTGEDFVFYGKICDLSSNLHLLIPTGISKDCNRICVFDSNKKEIVKTLSYDDDVISNITMQTNCLFTLQNEKLSFCPPCITNYLYTFDKKSLTLEKNYYIDFGKNGLTASDVNQFGDNDNRRSEYLLTCEKAMPIKTFYVGSHVVFLVKVNNDIKKWYTLIYDTTTQKLSSIQNYDKKEIKFPGLLSACGNSLFSAVEIRQLKSLLSPFGDNVDWTYFDDSNDDNDYVIVEYTFK